MHPLKLIGWEGAWGALILVIALPLLTTFPCSAPFCPHGKIEDLGLAL
jgi:hypothetical protein